MGVRILRSREDWGTQAALYCSTTGVAFGPVLESSNRDEHDADERAEAFCRWLKQDARSFTDSELMAKYSEWLGQEDAQWAAEKAAEEARWAEEMAE